jgi:hypothetical protein
MPQRTLQAQVTPWRPADLDHVVVVLQQELSRGRTVFTEVRRLEAPIGATSTLTFSSLQGGATYRAIGRAYITPDDAATGLVSVDDASSVAIAIPTGATTVEALLPVRLVDKPFSATLGATGPMIATGTLVTVDDEAMELAP